MSNIIQYNTKLFTDIYENVSDFISDFTSIGLGGIESTTANKLYYLLYARYGNSPIANMDENQFKYKLFSVIFMYGPAWEKRLGIQEALRTLNLDELREGTLAIYNHAFNPETAPKTTDKLELDYINDQNTTRYTRGKLDAYANLWELINTDVTNQFLNKFQICFKNFVRPVNQIVYETEES